MQGVEQVRSGSCLCGGVRYRITGQVREVVNCFCTQCRKTTGHHFAATRCRKDRFQLLEDQTLEWYRSSENARRGFCNRCGSSLFWEPDDMDTISVTAGTLDAPTGLKTVRNIYLDDMSDYHDIPVLSSDE